MPVVAYLAQGGELVGWLWKNRTEIGTFVEGLMDRVVARDGSSVDRIGAALVAQQDGQRQVIGMLQEVSGKADTIQAGIAGLEVGQQALSHSLFVLQSLSIVSLGVTALSQVYLWRQFGKLHRRLDTLSRKLDRIHTMIQAQQRAHIETGLTQLRHGTEEISNGNRNLAEQFLTDAFDNLATGANNFGVQLATELDRNAEREYLWLVARYLTIAVLGEAGCLVALGKGTEAARTIEGRLPTLRLFAKRVFDQTVGRDPTRFLMPAMAAHGLTLDYLAQLFRQASLGNLIEANDYSGATEFFEVVRPELFRVRDPLFRKSRTVGRMLKELADATAAVEEFNRVQSLALCIRSFDRPGQSFHELAAMIEREVAARAGTDVYGCFAYIHSNPESKSTTTHQETGRSNG